MRELDRQQTLRVHRALSEPLVVEAVRREPLLNIRVRGSQGISYQIELQRDARFKCSCPDFERNCRCQGMVCKHISYCVLRVFGCIPRSLLERGQLTRDEVVELQEADLFPEEQSSKSSPFDLEGEPPDLDCPICFGSLLGESSVQCPDCRKALHRTCALRWFLKGRPKTCIMCRSLKWSTFVS
jgi:hypothetical protein